MTERKRYAVLTRREAILRAASLLGTAGVAAQIGACSGEKTVADLPDNHVQNFFSHEQFRLLDRVADLIIPDTDTPGASAAGVPEVLDAMMTNWASSETQQKWADALGAIDARASELHGAAFAELEPDVQLETLRAYDKEMLTSGGGDYRAIKDLILVAYYSSEIGATQELRFELVPGAYRGCVPFSEIGRTWAD